MKIKYKFYAYKQHQIAISAEQIRGEAARVVKITSPADAQGMQHVLFNDKFYDHFNIIDSILGRAKEWINNRIAEANRK